MFTVGLYMHDCPIGSLVPTTEEKVTHVPLVVQAGVNKLKLLKEERKSAL